MEIAKRMLWCCLGWLLGGAAFGILSGIIVGGVFGAIYVRALMGFVGGAIFGAPEGCISGALSFVIASLLRLRSPELLKLPCFKATMRTAFKMCALGAAAGAMTIASGAFLMSVIHQESIGTRMNATAMGFFFGCQVGFNLGFWVGAIWPAYTQDIPESRDELEPESRGELEIDAIYYSR